MVHAFVDLLTSVRGASYVGAVHDSAPEHGRRIRRGDIALRPASRDESNELVRRWHRHHRPVKGHKWSIAAEVDGEVVGAVIVGRPVAQALDDGRTYEIVRLVTDGHRDVASKLIAAAWRAARAMGVKRMVSYTRVDEEGTCYRAAGWQPVAKVKGREWTHRRRAGSRGSAQYLPGLFEPATETVDRVRWEILG